MSSDPRNDLLQKSLEKTLYLNEVARMKCQNPVSVELSVDELMTIITHIQITCQVMKGSKHEFSRQRLYGISQKIEKHLEPYPIVKTCIDKKWKELGLQQELENENPTN